MPLRLSESPLPLKLSDTVFGSSALTASAWTDDAIVVPPGLPAIIGKTALRQYVENSLQVPGFRITWSTEKTVLSPDRQFAYLLGNNAVTMNDQTGAPVTTEGRALTIWRRETDGEWRCAVDIWNAEPPA